MANSSYRAEAELQSALQRLAEVHVLLAQQFDRFCGISQEGLVCA